MGESDKDAAAKGYYNDVKGLNSQVNNRFGGYQDAYSTPDILSAYNDIFQQGKNNIQADTQNQISSGVQGNTARMASQGITSGSMLNNSNKALTTGIGNNTTNALRQLNAQQAGGIPGILNQGNQNKFAATQAAQGVDMNNIHNLFAKYGLQGGAMQGLKDTTWLDDALGVANAAANVGKAFAAF